MKKTILALSFLSLFFLEAKAEKDLGKDEFLNPLHTGVPALSIAPDARAGGMGDIGAATTPDVFSQHWNPSKYAFMESPAGAAFSYTPWLSDLVKDINLFYGVGYYKLDEYQALSASVRYFSLGKVILRSDQYDTGIPANPNEFAVDLAYSRKLSEHFSASVLFRFIRSDLDVTASSSAGSSMEPGKSYATDISAYYKTPIMMAAGDANLSFGLAITNLGTKISYDGGMNKNFIPTNLRLGGSFDIPLDSYNRLSINADANKLLVPSKNPGMTNAVFSDITVLDGIFRSFSDSPQGFKGELKEIMWSAGLEYSYNNQFFVRGGYFNEDNSIGGRKYFTVGAGFKLNVFQIDAGYVIATHPSNPLNNTLRLSLSFDMDGLKNLAY